VNDSNTPQFSATAAGTATAYLKLKMTPGMMNSRYPSIVTRK
jgi:hypothetical protein